MSSKLDQPLVQGKEEKVALNFKQLKSIELLKYALAIFNSNTHLMLYSILSIVPFFVFIVFCETKIYRAMHELPYFQNFLLAFVSGSFYSGSFDYSGDFNGSRELFLLQVCLLYLVLYRLLELFSMTVTVKLAAKILQGEKRATSKDTQVVFNQKNYSSGRFITCLSVQVLSTLIFLGGFWVVVSCIPSNFYLYVRDFLSVEEELGSKILSVGFHLVIFAALLYMYLRWSAFWNMALVVLILEEETGIEALDIADFYGKQHKQTGYRLTLVFLAFDVVLRLPSLYAGLCNTIVAGVSVTVAVFGFLCLRNLVKWITFVLHFYNCKQLTIDNKVDVEVEKLVDAGDVC